MYHDGKTYIWIPSALTMNKVTTFTAAIINTVHAMIGRPTVTVGDLNPYYFDLNDLDMGGAPFTRDEVPGMAVCGPIENLGYLGLDYVSLIVAIGQAANAVETQITEQPSTLFGDIEGMPVWFELDDQDTDCPFSTETPKETWATWGTFGQSHLPVEIDGKWYRSSAVGQSGQLLDASAWVGLRAAGLVVKTKAEYLKIQSANQPSMP